MQRIPRLTERFNRRRHALGLTSGTEAIALARAVGALARGPLPGPADFETLVPPVARWWFRRVPGASLWVLFTFDESSVTLRSVTDHPPIPVDED